MSELHTTRTGGASGRLIVCTATALVLMVLFAACSAKGSGSATASSGGRAAGSSHGARASGAAHRSPGCSGGTRGVAEANAPGTITVDGVERTYHVAAPATAKPSPLLVVLHGLGQTGAAIDQISNLPARGTAAGTIVVTPDAVGTPALWRPAGTGPDADFLAALITDVEAHDCVDLARVGIVGFSVGALFAIAYGCAHQDQIAAIVTVELDAPGSCTKAMPILAFHATGDPVVAYAPPPGVTPLGGGYGTEANMAKWASISGCETTPLSTEMDSGVTKLKWPHCADGSEVTLYKLTGGGHEWPPARQVDAAEVAVDFVRRHPLQQR